MNFFNETLLEQCQSFTQPHYQGLSRQVIFTHRTMTLYHYQPLVAQRIKTPLLLVFALVNRPSILDIAPELSFIQHLLAAGVDVYLLDWGSPTPADHDVTLATYILDYLDRAVDAVIDRQDQQNAINLLGICQGGFMSLCYASYRTHKIQKLVTMVTPVDFNISNHFLSGFLRKISISALQKKFPVLIPGSFLSQFFIGLKPYSLTIGKSVSLHNYLNDKKRLTEFLAVEAWLSDPVDLVTEAMTDFIRIGYQQNQLLDNTLVLNDYPINLNALNMPILNIYAKQDHIVPPASSRALKQAVSGPYQQIIFDGGHIGIYLNKQALASIPAKIAQWLERS